MTKDVTKPQLPTFRVSTTWHSEAVGIVHDLYRHTAQEADGPLLAEIRCGIGKKRCGTVVARIYDIPEDMTGVFGIGTCRKHDHRDGPDDRASTATRTRGEVPRWSWRAARWTDLRALMAAAPPGRTLDITALEPPN